jgi:hypothetical protein
MKKLFAHTLVITLPFICVFGSETAAWDLAKNTVTYTVSSTFGRNTPTVISLSQFDASDVVLQEESGEYVLSKVVLTLNGSISAVLSYQNTTASSQDVAVQNVGGGSYFTYSPLSLTSASENYSIQHNFGTVASGATVTAGDPTPLQALGSGAVSSGFITSDLSSFIGSGDISTVVTFASMLWDWGGIEGSKNETLVRSADMSVTYYYDVVPEPSTSALACLGSAVLLLRRRRTAAR